MLLRHPAPTRRRSTTRRLALSFGCLIAAASALPAAHAAAQGGDAEVTTSALLIPEAGATAAQSSVVTIGLRRGVREVPGVSFVHPVDVTSTVEFSQEVQDAIDELDPLADMVRTGNARAAAHRADQIVRIFEANLERIRRAQLVDAYMLAAVARCQAGRRRDCAERIAEIVAFREGLGYDVERYGPETLEVFERARVRALSGGRGSLIVETEPEGAEVYVDGRSYGPSPIRADGLLGGRHYVTIKELGYRARIVRADVRAGRENMERYELEPSEDAQRVLGLRDGIRGELGEARAGPNIRSLANSLGTTQVIVGAIRPAAGGQAHVQLYLYHVHTRLLQSQVEATVSADEAGMERSRQLALELYEGVDLAGGIAAPDDPETGVEQPGELYEQWWFWVAVIGGAAVLAGAIGAGAAAADQESVPDGFLRFQGELP